MPPKVPPVQCLSFREPSSYKVKSIFLTSISEVLETPIIPFNYTPVWVRINNNIFIIFYQDKTYNILVIIWL